MNILFGKGRLNVRNFLLSAVGTVAIALMMSSSAPAGVMYGTLTGDPRYPELDGVLEVGVKVNWIDGESRAVWEVTLKKPQAAAVKMTTFFFNLATPVTDANITFENELIGGRSQSSWVIEVNPHLSGGGSISFDFGDGGPNQQAPITNDLKLSFDAILDGQVWSNSIFTDADLSSSSNSTIVPGQMGGHIQGLTGFDPNSGFVTGNYSELPPDEDDPSLAPEPTSVAAWAMGVLICGVNSRRRRKSAT